MPQLVIDNKPKAALSEEDATAVIYLRVSSPKQLTGPSQEGYSIEGQREACERHAARLGAHVIREYVEPGKTATNTRRPALQRMLAELGELQPTYAIFYDLSRVAREEIDAFWLLGEINRHGTKLESTLERIDGSPQGLFCSGSWPASMRSARAETARRSRWAGAQVRRWWHPRPGPHRLPKHSRDDVQRQGSAIDCPRS